MGQLATAQMTRRQINSIDLQGSDLPVQASELKASEQRERLNRVAEELVEMLDELESRLRADRSRAVPIIAEYLGPLETAAEDISSIRDIDERFGGSGDRIPRIARYAEQLEKGLAYLLGVLSVEVQPSWSSGT